jgi:3-oxoadipate enol-lactonase
MRTGKVKSNGQMLYWESHGEGSPLVLVMGIGYDATLWGLYQVPFFSDYFQTIVFDNRDVGRSSQATEAYTIADMADDVAGLLDGLGIERAHILGLSMGGMIGQEFAIRHPERLNKLVLTGTSAAPARAKFDPISVWSFVKTHDPECTLRIKSYTGSPTKNPETNRFVASHESPSCTLGGLLLPVEVFDRE